MWRHFLRTVEEIADIEHKLAELIKKDEQCRRLQALEGVGLVGALLLKIVLGNPGHFKNGREAAACVGLTPVQHSSGGKERIGSISRVSGNSRLRSALFQGALATITQLERRPCRTQKEVWLSQLVARRGKKVAAIALANKTVRTAYALLKQGKEYQPELLAA
ncbi:IS116/IS110/IS902 family transposase [Hahella chejuensis KCTC 2396]|uniref:IS116/IS110/IS902 family transposase n=1 Tax=Hahella chejuensis (strain KCTC 2396) TaxID=349521 RepID=Q2SH29_HAHCH|nr:IS116/IS110/IS902 family transposase [Hahella chejuensis KCTC 2396]